jgi:hypothetical protein
MRWTVSEPSTLGVTGGGDFGGMRPYGDQVDEAGAHRGRIDCYSTLRGRGGRKRFP